MNIFAKLQKARVDLQGKPLKKSGINKFAGYEYFELEDFLPTVQQIFNELGICGIISFTEDTATLAIHDTETECKVEFNAPMAGVELKGCHAIQNMGAVISYMRRYLWMLALEIVENDELDATTGNRTEHKQQAQDDKPWYNDLDKHREKMIAEIKAGKKAEQILASLREKFKVNKKVADEILELGK